MTSFQPVRDAYRMWVLTDDQLTLEIDAVLPLGVEAPATTPSTLSPDEGVSGRSTQ